MSRFSRRQFVQSSLALGGLLSACTFQPPWQRPARVPRIGYLGIGAAMPNTLLLEAFRQGLRDLGYVEGQNLLIEYRFTDGRLEQGPALAAELVALEVDLIVATGIEAAVAAKGATTIIPIVGTILSGDPVGLGLVASLARPGGNVTGLGTTARGIQAKLLQILKEVVPTVGRLAVLWNPNNPVKVTEFKEFEASAPSFGLDLVSLEVRRDDDFEGAFRALAASGADALMALQEPLTAAHSARITVVAVELQLPAIYPVRLWVDAGGLMSYGFNSADLYYRAATYVDKILKGASPADLPVELPTRFDFVINQKAADAIGLTIPSSVIAQATEIIR